MNRINVFDDQFVKEKKKLMANLCIENDAFYDAPEEISSESDSASSDSSSELQQVDADDDELNDLHYDIWSRNPKSIDERRNEFIRKTGFVLDRCQTAREGPDDNGCMNPRKCNDRTTAVANEYDEAKDLVAGNEGDKDLLWRIQCLDDDDDGVSRKFDEIGGNSSVTDVDDFQSKFGSSNLGSSNLVQNYMKTEPETENEMVCQNQNQKKPQCKDGWFKRFSFKASNMFNKDKESKELFQKCKSLGSDSQRVRVRSHKKWSKELSSLFRKQEFCAHKGSILAMKFSLDGQYLATCGEDKTLNVWKVTEDETLADFDLLNFNSVSANLNLSVNGILNLACFLKFKEEGKVINNKNKKSSESDGIMIPRKVFQIQEKPLHEFHGHEGEILDISWSKNGHLLSSSVDKTARLWKVGCSQCLRVFPHNDFVTCAQFNPMDDSYFISGSIDGLVRIWDIQRCQVVDWIDIKEIVTAICYRPDGKGGIVGSMAGNCTFFEIADDILHRISVMYLQDKKMLTCKKITGFQFSPNNPGEVIVSSADSLIRILKGANIIRKFRGSLASIDRGGQLCASFTADGQHIVSATENSNVYVWNHFNNRRITSNKPKNIWSCESFASENAMIALPWHGISSTSTLPSSTRNNHESFVSSNHHSVNPNEVSSMMTSNQEIDSSPVIGDIEYEFLRNVCESVLSGSHMWGLVIVTAGRDGWIRTFHNYGLPVRYPTRKSLKSSFSFSTIRNRCKENCSNLKGSTSLDR